MFKKYFSIVVIPRKTSKIRKVKIPLFLMVILGLLMVGLLSGFTYIVFDYFNIRTELAGIDEGKSLKNQQKVSIQEFDRQYQEMKLHFDHLNSLTEKLRTMVTTNIETERKSRLKVTDEALLNEKIDKAEKSSILDVIATDSSELDSDLKYEQELSSRNMITYFNERRNPFARIPAGLPVNGYLINEFGLHTDPYTGQMRPQNGIDIASRLDFPVKAPADGIIIELKYDEDLGRVLVIDHGNGFKTRYGHLGDYEVVKGDTVKRGDVVALVGNTGKTTGPRLYYEVTFNEVPQNPVKYINK